MKKKYLYIFILFGLLINMSTNAQLSKIGGGIVLASKGKYFHNDFNYYNSPFGIDIRCVFDVNKQFRIVPDFQLFLTNNFEYASGGESNTTLFAFDINGHYILNPKRKFVFYLLGGLHLGGWNIKDYHEEYPEPVDYNDFVFDYGVNLGGGILFKISRKLEFFAEIKYPVAKTHQTIFTPGIAYVF